MVLTRVSNPPIISYMSTSPAPSLMQPARFCDWLQGYVELSGEIPTAAQWASIKDHLALVYTKVTPDHTKPKPQRPTVWPDGFPFPSDATYCASTQDGRLCNINGGDGTLIC